MTLHINRGVNRRYHVLVRRKGHRKYEYVSEHRTRRAAALVLAEKMGASSDYKRGAVTFSSDYYDPVAILEMVRP